MVLLTFFMCRIALFPYMYWAYGQHYGIPLYSVPFHLPLSTNLGNSCILAPQVYWFVLLCRKGYRLYRRSRMPDSSPAATITDSSKDDWCLVHDCSLKPHTQLTNPTTSARALVWLDTFPTPPLYCSTPGLPALVLQLRGIFPHTLTPLLQICCLKWTSPPIQVYYWSLMIWGVFLGGGDLAFAWILLKCYTASDISSTTMRRDLICSTASKTWRRKKNPPETEEDPLWRDNILSLTPSVFTASADLEGLLQCVWEFLLRQVVFIFYGFFCNVSDSCVSSPIRSLITLDKKD